jgi:hypothetical protein
VKKRKNKIDLPTFELTEEVKASVKIVFKEEKRLV